MPYKYITHKNGFTEIIPVNLTVAEEAAQMGRMNGVKSFPSANYRTDSKKIQKLAMLKTPLKLNQH